MKSVLGKGHSERCFGKRICHKEKATLTSTEGRNRERADSGTASVCGEATEKNEMAASLTSGRGAPLWRIPAAHGSKRGPAPGKR